MHTASKHWSQASSPRGGPQTVHDTSHHTLDALQRRTSMAKMSNVGKMNSKLPPYLHKNVRENCRMLHCTLCTRLLKGLQQMGARVAPIRCSARWHTAMQMTEQSPQARTFTAHAKRTMGPTHSQHATPFASFWAGTTILMWDGITTP